jgi:ApaG protein
VEVRFLPGQSDPLTDRYVFAYHIVIRNESEITVQLMRRRWLIAENGSHIREVEGPGVVGEQPILPPGASHEYTSHAVIRSPSGAMHGTYEMHTIDGRIFHAQVPKFPLEMPRILH